MADLNQVETVLSAAAPQAYAEVDTATKENFGRVVDYYVALGHTADDAVSVVDEQLGATDLAEATAPRLIEAVDNLCAAISTESEHADVPAEEAPNEPADEAPSEKEIFAALGDAAAEDLAEALRGPQAEAAVVRAVWDEVRQALQAEIARNPGAWLAEDVRNAAYHALWTALEGFVDEGEAEGFGAVLDNLK